MKSIIARLESRLTVGNPISRSSSARLELSLIARYSITRRGRWIERAGHVILHLRLVRLPEAVELADGIVVGPVDAQIHDRPALIADDLQRRRMHRARFAA